MRMSIYISIFLPICMALYLFVCVCLFVYLLSCPVVLFLTFFPRDMLVSRYQHSAATVAICLFKLRSPPNMRPQFMSFNGPKEVLPAKFEELFLWSVLDIEHSWLLKISASVEPGSLPKLLRISNSKRWPQINRDYAGRYWTVSLYTISFRGRRKQEENFNEVARHSMPLLGQSFLATAFSSIRCDAPKKITVSSDFCGYGTAVSLPSLNIIMALKQIYLGMH